jgi:hypothetical protein
MLVGIPIPKHISPRCHESVCPLTLPLVSRLDATQCALADLIRPVLHSCPGHCARHVDYTNTVALFLQRASMTNPVQQACSLQPANDDGDGAADLLDTPRRAVKRPLEEPSSADTHSQGDAKRPSNIGSDGVPKKKAAIPACTPRHSSKRELDEAWHYFSLIGTDGFTYPQHVIASAMSLMKQRTLWYQTYQD